MKLERRRSSALNTADTALAVVVGVIAIMALFAVVSWLIGTFLFIVKLAVVGLIIAAVVALVSKLKS